MRIALVLLPVALALKAVSSLDVVQVHVLPAGRQGYESLLFSLCGFIGTPLLAIAYLIFGSLFLQGKTGRFWRWVAATGRLGLTNYVTQTGLCTVLFYGYACGLSGRVTLAESFLHVIVIYAVQVVYSNLWLRDHATGPVEKLWRWLSYGKSSLQVAGELKPVDVLAER